MSRKIGEPYDELDMPELRGSAIVQEAFLSELIKYKIALNSDLKKATTKGHNSYPQIIYALKKNLAKVGIGVYSIHGVGYTLYPELAKTAHEIRAPKILGLLESHPEGLDCYQIAEMMIESPATIRKTIKAMQGEAIQKEKRMTGSRPRILYKKGGSND